jgi:preprotein translocase subunit SecG
MALIFIIAIILLALFAARQGKARSQHDALRPCSRAVD